jgi:hypothetical protein
MISDKVKMEHWYTKLKSCSVFFFMSRKFAITVGKCVKLLLVSVKVGNRVGTRLGPSFM